MRTDEDGFYYADNLSVGKGRIECGYYRKTINLEDGQDLELDFVIPKGHTLSGKIVDKNLGPTIIAMLLNIYPPNSDFSFIARITNNSGEFSVPEIPDGQYKLRFHIYVGKAGKPVWAFQYSRIIEIANKDMELNIITETSLFSGKLIASNGTPLQKSLVLESLDNPGCEYTGCSKKDGTFDYGRIPPGKYNLSIWSGPFIQQIEIPEGKDLTDVTITVGNRNPTFTFGVFPSFLYKYPKNFF